MSGDLSDEEIAHRAAKLRNLMSAMITRVCVECGSDFRCGIEENTTLFGVGHRLHGPLCIDCYGDLLESGDYTED